MVTEWCALHLDEDREGCDEVSREVVYPTPNHASAPTAQMPEDVVQDFKEAGAVLALSPLARAAILRLALQKLCVHLGQSGKDINKDIGALVKEGHKPSIQRALDIVRVIGNEAVHPGSLDLRDDQETALALFRLLNLIVEKMIAIPTQIDTLYKTLPKEKLTGIENRDHST